MRPPKGGISRVLAAVDGDGEEVVAGLELAGEPRLERRVAILVRGDLVAVEIDDRVGHGAVEDQRDFLAVPGRIGVELFW